MQSGWAREFLCVQVCVCVCEREEGMGEKILEIMHDVVFSLVTFGVYFSAAPFFKVCSVVF